MVEAVKKEASNLRLACGINRGRKGRPSITVLPKDMVPPGLHVIDGRPLPNLKDTEIALLQREGLSVPARRLMEHVINSLG